MDTQQEGVVHDMELLQDSHISIDLVHHCPMRDWVQLKAQIHVQILRQQNLIGKAQTLSDIVSSAAPRAACIIWATVLRIITNIMKAWYLQSRRLHERQLLTQAFMASSICSMTQRAAEIDT